MSAVRAERPAMATPILPPPPPRIKPGTWGFSLAGLIGTLALAGAACAAGTTLVQKAPQPPSSVVVLPQEVAHASVAVARSAGALATYTPPPVALVSGTIQGVDGQSGGVRLLIDGGPYIFYINRETAFPDSCLQMADLRAGLHVTLSLPWYLGGQLAAHTIGPSFGCNSDGSLRQFREIPSGEDAPPPVAPRRHAPAAPATAPSYLPPYFAGAGQSRTNIHATSPTDGHLPAYLRHDALVLPTGSKGRATATIPIPRLRIRPAGLGGW